MDGKSWGDPNWFGVTLTDRHPVACMTWNDASKTVLVTLNDRNAMQFRLLLGRNWLRGDYIVDVDINNDD